MERKRRRLRRAASQARDCARPRAGSEAVHDRRQPLLRDDPLQTESSVLRSVLAAGQIAAEKSARSEERGAEALLLYYAQAINYRSDMRVLDHLHSSPIASAAVPLSAPECHRELLVQSSPVESFASATSTCR